MNSFLTNTVSKLYNAVSAPVAATRDALAERLQSIRGTVSLLYKRMIKKMIDLFKNAILYTIGDVCCLVAHAEICSRSSKGAS